MIYAVSPLAQEAEVDYYCFGKCGMILFAGLEIEGAPFCPCRTEPCPYEEKSKNLGKAWVDGAWEEVTVRKLKPIEEE